MAKNEVLEDVHNILAKNELERQHIKSRLNASEPAENFLDRKQLDPKKVFHLQEIHKICVDYRLRFLDARFFKGTVPEEAITKIRELEAKYATTLGSFKILAPAKLLKLENADDPLLFVPLSNEHFYLIHKWGNDLHPLRKWLMWPFKNFENIIATIFVLSIALTALTPMQAFTKSAVTQTEYLLMFLFMFKSVAGLVLFYGFAKGKNFNEAIWNSKYYNA
ncbi:MAG TPA: hypothetical protein PKW08_13555 [Flavobacteriaceae bacterium]|nr:hypothetical protein [Flavobacteriaceae bacterium]